MPFAVINPFFQFFDNVGEPLDGGTVETYESGTSTPKVTYQDATLTTPNSTTIDLDSAGRCSMFVGDGETFKYILKDASGVTLDTQDGVKSPIGTQAGIADLLNPQTTAELAEGITPSNRLYAEVNVLRYGADPTGATDSTAAFQAAIDVAQAYGAFGSGSLIPISGTTPLFSGAEVYAPRGKYLITDTLLVTSMCAIVGDGPSASVIFYDGSGSLTTSDYLIDIGVSPTGTSRLRPFRLQDLTLMTTDSATFGQNSPRGINLLDVHQWVIDRVHFNYLHFGIYAEDSWIGEITRCLFYDNYAGHVNFQAQVHNTKLRNNTFNQCHAILSGHPAATQVYIRNCHAVDITANDFEFAFENNILLNNDCRSVTVEKNYFESSPDGRPVYMWDGNSGVGCTNVSIRDNYINTGGLAITCRNTNASPTAHKGIVIEGNYAFVDAAQYLVLLSGSTPVENSSVRQNVVVQGLGEIDRTADTGFDLEDAWPFRESGTFTATFTGFSTAQTGTAYWTREGNHVVVSFPNVFATSNATTFTITGLPTALQIPARVGTYGVTHLVAAQDNGADTIATALLPEASSTITLSKGTVTSGGAWTGSAQKGVQAFCLVYEISAS